MSSAEENKNQAVSAWRGLILEPTSSKQDSQQATQQTTDGLIGFDYDHLTDHKVHDEDEDWFRGVDGVGGTVPGGRPGMCIIV